MQQSTVDLGTNHAQNHQSTFQGSRGSLSHLRQNSQASLGKESHTLAARSVHPSNLNVSHSKADAASFKKQVLPKIDEAKLLITQPTQTSVISFAANKSSGRPLRQLDGIKLKLASVPRRIVKNNHAINQTLVNDDDHANSILSSSKTLYVPLDRKNEQLRALFKRLSGSTRTLDRKKFKQFLIGEFSGAGLRIY